MSETNVEPTNCLDIIEQLRFDRDKYIGMWRSQCNIAEEVMKERDCLTAELAGASREINRRDEFCKKCEMGYEAKLERYKQGVEMDGEVRYILAAKSKGTCGKAQIIIPIIPIDDSLLIGNRVRVLVMKVEE